MGSKAWKLSASVIITLRSDLARLGTPKLSDSFSRESREDPSIIPKNNLEILSLRRSQTDKYLPGAHVFPGGNLHASDSSPEWLDLFHKFGFDENSFKPVSVCKDVDFPQYSQPLSVSSWHNESALESHPSALPGWLAFRLCAIREAFEECGILLGRLPREEEKRPQWGSFVPVRDLSSWQERVRGDPHQMIALCKAEGCVPDVWSLNLWSNWLTPAQQCIRFNAMFFLVVLSTKPPHLLDDFEMDELKWSTPLDLVEGASSGKHHLINPQLYEASRLSVITDADTLIEFATSRAQHGCPAWMPVQQITKDGMLVLLPGDSAYPEETDLINSQKPVKWSETLAELRDKIKKAGGTLHRMEKLKSETSARIVVDNYIPTHKHMLPLSSDAILDAMQSKL